MKEHKTKQELSMKLAHIKLAGFGDIESVLRSVLFNSGTVIDWDFVQRELDKAYPEDSK